MPVTQVHGFSIAHEVEGPGTLWISLEETERLTRELHKKKEVKIPMLPLGELFGEAPPSAMAKPLWESEAALFVRWGLFGPARENPALYRAFLEFVRRARSEPVTEGLFTDCFGFGYAAMQVKLDSFLRDVLALPTSAQMEIPRTFEEPALTRATDDQIGRILGDWLRMEGDAQRRQDPDASANFLRAAGRMLERAYRSDNGLPPDVDPSAAAAPNSNESPNIRFGPPLVIKPFVVSASKIHDPGLLAVYGLYENDIGETAKAREFLEAAARQGVVRPMAYLSLARIRYAEASAKPQGVGRTLSLGQIGDITEPLHTAMESSAPATAYAVMVDAWSRSDAKPPRPDIDDILKGASLYPRDLPLVYQSALLCLRVGDDADAARLIDRGLVFTTHEGSREYFEKLRAELASPPSAP